MNYTETSKFLSLILRHKPELIGIVIDKHGYAKVDELLEKMNITFEDLEYIVNTDNKQRYSFNEDKTLVRANQGHSLDVDVGLEKALPPPILYHGTKIDKLKSIKKQGLKSMNRLYVHLSEDIETAKNVAERKKGQSVILKINTKKMIEDHVVFYRSKNNVWLVKYVDSQYIRED